MLHVHMSVELQQFPNALKTGGCPFFFGIIEQLGSKVNALFMVYVCVVANVGMPRECTCMEV